MDVSQISPSAKAKMLMLQRGLRPRDVALGTGLALSYVYRLLSGHEVTKRGRERIEKFFGVPIWSGAKDPQRNGHHD
jgi:hypothetical protein